MYNRYIPQPDGSHRRNPVRDGQLPPSRQPQPQHKIPTPSPPPATAEKSPAAEPFSGFLRQLIPHGFDTGDLIVVLLLLLIAGDNREARNNALLTIALYFIL